nr:copia protein [Tanacetum cinerariifolium]
AKLTEKHLKEVKRIFCYLRGTVNTGLCYTKDFGFELTGFSNADYVGCKDTFKSTSGGAQFLGEKLVSWSSKKQDCTALSTAKTKYVSLSACCAQVLWMRTQLTDYGFHFNKIPIYCDSKLAIAISCNPVQHSRTKHIAVRYHFIKDHVEKGTFELYFIKTDYQLADIFTKAFPADRFNYLVRRFGENFGISGKLNVSRMISQDTLIDFIKLFYGSAWKYIKDQPTVASQGVIRQLRLGSVDGVTTSLQLSRNSRPHMLDHQDKYIMKAQGLRGARKLEQGALHLYVGNGVRAQALQSDRGGEYISQEFKDYLKACGIVQQLTPPYTPQHNGVPERRDRTLLDMVRSMMNLTTLPLSFWDYALKSITRILNMVPSKKGCEALVKQDTPDKLQQISVKCVFIGYPKKTMGYYFYFQPENKIFVASEIPMVVEGFKPPQEQVTLIRRFERTHQAPNHLCLNVEAKKDSLRDLNEPTSYKAAIAIRIPISISAFYDYKIWQIDVKNAFLNGYLDEDIYMVQPEGFVDSKYSRKVCKLQRSIYGLKQASRSWNKRFDEEIKKLGFAQNLNEPCVYKKASRSNVTFLILYVADIIIMGNHIPSLQSVKDYFRKCLAMKDLRESSFILRIKIYRDRLDLNKTQCASTPEEVKRMQNVPYALAMGFIRYEARCTRPNVPFAQNITCRFQQNPGAVDWKSSKQSTIAISATEAEYIAASEAAMKAVWIRKFISGLGIVPTINEPIKMFCDNSTVLFIGNEPGVQKGARHYHRRYHYVRECIELGEINLLKVHTRQSS